MSSGLDFPSNPANNSTYSLGSRTWRFNGSGWVIVNNNTGPQGVQGPQGVGTITGSGTVNTVAKFVTTTSVGDSGMTDDGTTVALVSRALSGTSASFSSSVTASSFFESSSVRGKDIIATNPLLALNIDVIKYTRKTDVNKDIRYGYSAEQIHSLMPELTDRDVTSVKYLDVHTILIAQLQQEIRELKAKLK